jgi:hypothetical protein
MFLPATKPTQDKSDDEQSDKSDDEQSQVPTGTQFIQQEAQFFRDAGAKRTKVIYKPVTIPGRGHNDGMMGYSLADAEPPCTGCVITQMYTDLEYVNGTTARADDGMWLHHALFRALDEKPNTKAALSKKETISQCNRSHLETFFASGNERTWVDLTLRGYVSSKELSHLSIITNWPKGDRKMGFC